MFAVADQRRFRPWLLASALVHALGAALLIAARPLPSPPPEPLRVVRVDLIAAHVAPGPPMAPPAPEVSAAPSPARVAAKPPAPKALAPKPVAPAPPAPAPAAPSAEPVAPAQGSAGGRGASEGAALAAVSTGPPAGGGGAAALADYIARLQRAIDAHKSYPSMARRRGIEGVVTVRLAIDARGVLEGTALVGRPPEILARSTREAVNRASPFPPPPAGALQIEFPVRYEIVD